MARPIVKRPLIEQGVVRVVAQKGLHATTIQDIALAAEVSPGLLYRYWANRDELAGEVYRRHYETALAMIDARVAVETQFWRKIAAAVEVFFAFADAEPVLLRFLLLSQHDLADHVPRERNVHQWLGRLLSEGIAQKQVRPLDLDLACGLATGVFLQPVISSLYGRLSTPVSQHVPEVVAALKRVLSPEKKPARQARPRRPRAMEA